MASLLFEIKSNMEKDFKWWLIFILLFIWQLPQALIGLIIMPFMGGITKVADRHYNFCWYGINMRGGISLGPFSYVSRYYSNKEPDIAHEVDGHTVDSKIFGPLYLIVIGIPSMLNAMFDFTKCYYDFYPEKWANKHAGLIVNDKCRLEFE